MQAYQVKNPPADRKQQLKNVLAMIGNWLAAGDKDSLWSARVAVDSALELVEESDVKPSEKPKQQWFW